MLAELEKEGIAKESKGMFFKSKVNALESKVYLTPSRLVVMSVSANKVRLGGAIGAILELTKKKTYPIPQVNVSLEDIKEMKQGKFGLNKQVVELTTKDEEVFKFSVDNYSSWESAVSAKN